MKVYLLYPTKEQESMLRAFLKANDIDFVEDGNEELPPRVLAGIARGQADIKAGRSVTLEEFKKKFPITPNLSK